MNTHTIRRALVMAVAVPGLLLAQQQPTFRSSVEMIAVNAQVMDGSGGPIGTLGTKDFQAWINGQMRRVASATLIQYPLSTPMNVFPKTFNNLDWIPGDVPEVRGRVFILAIDEMSFPTRSLPAVIRTAKRFLTRLRPEDVVGIYAYPFGSARIDLTHFHGSIGFALDHIQGLATPFNGSFSLSPSEVADITAGDGHVLAEVANRECGDTSRSFDFNCPTRLRNEAKGRAMFLQSQSENSFAGMKRLLQTLTQFSGPKTVVFLSAGLLSSDRVGAQPDVSGMVKTAGKYASAADATLYVLHMDDTYLDTYAATTQSVRTNAKEGDNRMVVSMSGPDTPVTPRATDQHLSQVRDSQLNALGLERLASEAGGQYIHIGAGSGDIAFDRVLKETSAYYLLGVQPEVADRDGRVHYIRVRVDSKGATVRARQQVTIPKAGG
jgi:VWFA-related protein